MLDVVDDGLEEGDGGEGEMPVLLGLWEFAWRAAGDGVGVDVAAESDGVVEGALRGVEGADEGAGMGHSVLDVAADGAVGEGGVGLEAALVEVESPLDLREGVGGEVGGGGGWLGVDVCDALGGAGGADLRGVEGAAAWSDAMGAGDFADGEEVRDGGFPPEVGGDAAVAVLGADGDFEGLPEVDAVFGVEVDALLVHVLESSVGRVLGGSGALEVVLGLGEEGVEAEGLHVGCGGWVVGEVEEDASSGGDFVVDGDVDDGGAAVLGSGGVEGPLVSLEEDAGGEVRHVIEVVVEEVSAVGVSVGGGREVVGDDLLVGAGEVPAEGGGGESELEFGEVVGLCAEVECEGVRAGLSVWPDGDAVEFAGASGGEDDVSRVDEGESVSVAVVLFAVEADGAGGVTVGGNKLAVIAGPCSVESQEQIVGVARDVQAAGAVALRGGAYKPRTSPYAFQGMGSRGIELLREAREATGLPIVTELMSADQIPLFEACVDVIQVGARNMQNFDLLKKLGKLNKPILLKRGLSSTIEEWVMSAEYILAGGNPNVILCERGIRTFETYTRNTLDLSAVLAAKQMTHLPVVVDPSHACGKAWMVERMSLAAVAAGADGLLIEVHNDPKNALCDGAQSITPAQFKDLMGKIGGIAACVGRSV